MGSNAKGMKTRATQVAQNIYQIVLPTPFAVGDINVFLIEGIGLTLVDTGPNTEEAWTALVQGIKDCGYEIRDIEHIILTHQHPDHCGLVEKIRKENGAQILGHPLIVPFIKHDKAYKMHYYRFFSALYSEHGVPQARITQAIQSSQKQYETFTEPSEINVLLKHKQPLLHCKEWQVLYTPGHAQGHISLFRKTDGILIGADLIFPHMSTNPLIEPPDPNTNERQMSLVQFRNTLQMCSNLGIRIVFPGHGESINDFEELVQVRLRRSGEKTEILHDLLNKGEKTAYQLTQLLFPKRADKDLISTFSDTLGHLELSQILYQVHARIVNGIKYYNL